MKAAKSSPALTIVQDFSIDPRTKGVVFRPVWCAAHHFTGPWPCSCRRGPQIVAAETDADEAGLGGSRGGAKSQLLLAKAAFRGNPKRAAKLQAAGKPVTGADAAYITHPNYRALVMRPQANDLVDLLDRAEEMYKPFGATVTRGNPPIVEWPSKAKIIFGHFGEDGWKKVMGTEYQFIGMDQAEMIPSKEVHDRIVGSCRSKWPELVPQTFLTFNPGGGDDLGGAPGQAWLMEYFRIEAYLSGKVPAYGKIRDEYGKIRQFIPSKVTDNPYLYYNRPDYDADGNIICASCRETVPIPLAEPYSAERCPLCEKQLLERGVYAKWLDSIEPESLRRAWRDGDWRALSGQYFRDFRPNGPLSGEPETANHIYDPAKVKLEPWFHAWMGIDWGYIHPTDIQFHRKAPWGQVYTFKEISVNRIEPFELGTLVAREARPVLDGLESHHMNVFLSPDAFAKRESEDTVASQFAAGINSILGPGSAFLADLTEAERQMRADDALLSLKTRRQAQHKTRLTIVRASTDRVAGWMHMQTMLRFRPLSEESQPDMDYAHRLYEEKGVVAYQEYMNLPEFSAPKETLPKWQISKECKWLISTLPKMMHKPGTNDILKKDATESAAGDDPADCARYSLLSEVHQGERLAPLDIRVSERVEKMKLEMPGLSGHSELMAQIAARRTEQFGNKKPPLPFSGHNRLAARRALWAARAGREHVGV